MIKLPQVVCLPWFQTVLENLRPLSADEFAINGS
jgi:hypothetical protein